jgi:hypothetical protein
MDGALVDKRGYDPSDLRIFNVFAGPDSWLTLLVIPTEKPSNKDMRSAEMVEGRRSTEGNIGSPDDDVVGPLPEGDRQDHASVRLAEVLSDAGPGKGQQNARVGPKKQLANQGRPFGRTRGGFGGAPGG